MNKDYADITIDTYNNIVNEYVEYYKSKDLKGNVQFQREMDFICERIKDNAKIIDVGTAIGDYPKYLTEKLSNRNFEVLGIDSSENMIKVAKEKAPKAKFEVMDLRKMNFDDESFDVILCFATLIHVNDEECIKVLNKFDRMLKKDGIIAINVMEWLEGDKELFIDESFNPKYKTYFNRYKKEFFEDFFKKLNYSILAMYDNPLFNTSKVEGEISKANQFTIIVKK